MRLRRGLPSRLGIAVLGSSGHGVGESGEIPELARSGMGDDRLVVPLGPSPGKGSRKADPEPEDPAVSQEERLAKQADGSLARASGASPPRIKEW